MPDKKNNLGSATRRVLFDFLGELKVDQEKKKPPKKPKDTKITKDMIRSGNDIQLFSKKLSNKGDKEEYKTKDEEKSFSDCKKIVLSDEEANRLMALNEEEDPS